MDWFMVFFGPFLVVLVLCQILFDIVIWTALNDFDETIKTLRKDYLRKEVR